MNNIFIRFVLEIIGATLVWAMKGFKGKLNDEMSGPYEYGQKWTRNLLVSGLFVVAVIYLLSHLGEKAE